MVMRILCLGNNTEDTDVKTRQLAEQQSVKCHGLISELDHVIDLESIQHPGYYHSSVYDLEYYRLIEIAQEFDQIVILDQPREQYSHPDAFYKTIRAAKQINNTVPVVYLDPTYKTSITFFEDLTKTNKSFCIFPFIELLANNDRTTVCCRSDTPITLLSDIVDFKTDPHYQKIRNNMLSGILMPKHCSHCYDLEQQGILSARMQETVEWANRLNLHSIDDLNNLHHPVYYEVRPSNICNLQCRTCTPDNSSLIAQEYKKINLIEDYNKKRYSNFDFVKIENIKKLYVAGGEPTAMLEFYNFVDQCIKDKKTNFEFVVNTNGTKLSDKFKQQLKEFSNFQFIVSIDGFNKLNHYIRWPSDWQTIIDNVQYLKQQNYVVSFNITVSIYNILTLYELLEFFDQVFPATLVHCQFAESEKELFSALNFPDRNLALENLMRIRELKCYKNDLLLQSFVDGVIMHYAKNFKLDLEKLKDFFKFNDKLDQSRNIRLADYIPELEAARKLI
jgi:sulfatase maturation enzyme AslB (radical SAM superfamily)